MRINPQSNIKEDSNEIAEENNKKIARNTAIAFVLLIQLAIIYKMLL